MHQHHGKLSMYLGQHKNVVISNRSQSTRYSAEVYKNSDTWVVRQGLGTLLLTLTRLDPGKLRGLVLTPTTIRASTEQQKEEDEVFMVLLEDPDQTNSFSLSLPAFI